MKIKMKKIPLLIPFLFVIALLFSSCMKLNGIYCTNSNSSSYCLDFDRKKHNLIIAHESDLTASLKKGKCRRFGNLIYLKLIPYPEKVYPVKISYLNDLQEDSIDLDLKFIDMGKDVVYIVDSLKNTISFGITNYYGEIKLRIAKKSKPKFINANVFIRPMPTILIPKLQSCKMEIVIKDDHVDENLKTGKEFYHIEKIKKDSFLFKQVNKISEWRFDKEQRTHKLRYYSKQKN